jgi:molecular chaperone GrpE
VYLPDPVTEKDPADLSNCPVLTIGKAFVPEGQHQNLFSKATVMTSKEKTQDQTLEEQKKNETGTAEKPGKKPAPKAKSHKSPHKKEDSAKLKELHKELQEQKDKYLRLSADFDNFRKRTLREKMDLSRQAGEEIFTRILPVLDDLERALISIGEARDMEAVKEGMILIHNKLKEYLSQQGVKEIEALHQDFNTDVHEAVSQIPSEKEEMKGKVVDVLEKGYFLNDKVIRYSKVVIGV